MIDDADLIVATSWQTAECLGSDPRGLYLIQHYEVWGGVQDRVDATWRLPLRKIVIAQWLRAKSEELGAGEVTLVPNAIDLGVFKMDVRPEDRSTDEVAMLWHKEGWKGSSDGLEALRLVRESRPNLHLTLFSTTKRPSEIPEWVTYVEKASEKQLRSIYNRAAVFVSPSHSEGWGLPPAEAMACGAAVVSTEIGGTGDYAFHDVTAVLTPVQNPEAMARAILELLDDDARRVRIASEGHEWICTNCSWELSTDLFEQALLEDSDSQKGE
ncbi:MAG: glycosyltransferase family 4 protein [Acidimicrobiales bacterium]